MFLPQLPNDTSAERLSQSEHLTLQNIWYTMRPRAPTDRLRIAREERKTQFKSQQREKQIFLSDFALQEKMNPMNS